MQGDLFCALREMTCFEHYAKRVTKVIFYSLIIIFVAETSPIGWTCDCNPGYFGALCEFST